ncbi:hypothetical protein DMN91_006004 [Ooceraea biroi]|uniref:Serine/threonine-protein phosphatase 6 regulatory ankyrin repeat subunit B n=1 Tax=Ooceraea biroi TaxID=2015173 RepID=A0A026WQH0_OOCBI|nr:Serine/threonine-protein phosphatase 6 regulatory ankyrin repeat subunit B [Ooceraea biroi]RLU21631.1 hypothetical protein DMN91_006004 [Ooceraea biroi]
MLRLQSHDDMKKAVETQVIEAMHKQGYSLNTVSNYDENLLHTSAANGCSEIVKEILNQKKNCRIVDRKNKFGWTPLMQAIRNGNVDTVKLLSEKNASVGELTYLGMSVLGLAAASGKEMFETVFNACPDSLMNAADDDISPLCVAAMKNDKQLFFRLLELGVPLSTANEYTHIMMRNSTVPEIAALAKTDLASDDYWNDTSDNIQVLSENDGDTTQMCSSILKNDENRKRGPARLHLLPAITESGKQDLISPNLTYDYKDVFASLANARFTEIDFVDKQKLFLKDKSTNKKRMESDLEKHDAMSEYQFKSPVVLQRLQQVRPRDLDIKNLLDDPNVTLGFTPEFSPPKSPHVPPDINDENVFGENTPTPPRCKTPPKGMLLNCQQSKMVVILRRFGLSQHIPIFLEQEVDIDLFLTLTDSDLIEIGIEHEKDRRVLLETIEECKRCKTY